MSVPRTLRNVGHFGRGDHAGRGIIVAIDGPAGSGKSSVSRAVAARLSVAYLDTGAMYRALTWAVLHADVDPDDPAAVAAYIEGPQAPAIVSGTDPSDPTIEVDGTDVREPIRGADVTANVSAVSAVPQVRGFLVELQRGEVAKAAHGIVVEGRDIGSVVLPDADLKVFLTADPAVRAQRRAAETSNGAHIEPTKLAATETSLRERDAKDSSRAHSPLTRADGAIEVDTSDLTFEQVVGAVAELINGAVAARGTGGAP